MPVDIETLEKEGKPVPIGRKAVDDDAVIEMLKQQAYTIKELADHFGVARGTMYAHLKKLKEQGKVEAKKLGKEVYYYAPA